MKILLPKVNSILKIGLFLMIIKVSFNTSRILFYNAEIDLVLSVLSAAALSIAILLQHHSYRTLIIYGCIEFLTIYSVMNTGNYGFLISVITCLAIRKEKIDTILNFIFKWELLYIIVHTICALCFDMILGISVTQVIDGTIRYNFGFNHPNQFSIYLFNLVLLWVWLNFNKINWRNIAKIFMISIVSYLFTKTRTILIEFMVLCAILMSIMNNKNKEHKALRIVAQFIFPICTIIMMYTTIQYTNGKYYINLIDKILSARIRLGAYAFEHFGLTFWGQNISDIKVIWDSYWQLNGHTFDNIYTSLAMNQGIIWLIIISILFYKLAKIRDVKVNICIIMWALYGITEVHGLNGYMCFPILLITLLFSTNARKSLNID